MTSETLISKTKETELKDAGYNYLGYENGFYINPPQEVKNCTHQKHSIENGTTCIQLIWCDECKIYWKMDSGD